MRVPAILAFNHVEISAGNRLRRLINRVLPPCGNGGQEGNLEDVHTGGKTDSWEGALSEGARESTTGGNPGALKSVDRAHLMKWRASARNRRSVVDRLGVVTRQPVTNMS